MFCVLGGVWLFKQFFSNLLAYLPQSHHHDKQLIPEQNSGEYNLL
jgi:hypothetical protein